MGCDIHLYVERRDGNRWVTADSWTRSYNRSAVNSVDNFYDWRDYALFAILADVRNWNDLLPIEYARGAPDDCCDEVRGEIERWKNDAHHHSWLTLREILAFDWTITKPQTGWVGPQQWYGWTQRRAPTEWMEHVADDCPCRRSNADFERAMETLESERRSASLAEDSHLARFCELVGDKSPVTEITWHIPYHDMVAPQFWTSTIPRLLALSRTPTFEDVRIVFFFDN